MLIAIYSLNINIKSRGKGQSAIAAAAYIAGERFKNEYDGTFHDRTERTDVIRTTIMLPDHAPERFYNRAELWNAVELSERAKNAQLCREIRIALPKEFDIDQNDYLVYDYVQQHFTSRGMCVDFVIHDKGDGNPHAHILLTMRPLEKDGTFGAKSRMEYILDDNGEKIKLPSGRYKTKKVTITDWDDRGNAEIWRKGWADTLNKHLKHFKHEEQVDHRSYERQGLEILPTIHLGATAHALEQKGVHTERGNINRAIIAENERIKNINKEIRKTKKEKHEILNPPPPPKPQFLIDVENSIKAKESPGYEHWCRIFNIQQMAKTLIFIQENGYTDIKSLQTAHQNASNDVTNTQKRINEIKGEIKTLRKQKEATETYRRTVDTWKEYNSNKWWRQSSKDKFYEDNKADIEAYKSARDYIYTELKLEKFPSLKKLSGEISTLTAEQKELEKALPTARQKANSLNVVNHNVQMLLGYRELELQERHPIATIKKRADVPVYKSKFAEAQKARETELYFQSQHLNHECAETLKTTITTNFDTPKEEQHNYVTIANAMTRIFGMERVKWVLDTPLVNVEDSKLRSAIDEVKAAVKRKEVDIYWDNKRSDYVSFKDKMAAAQRKVDRQKQNRDTTNNTKKKSYDRGFDD